MFIKSLPDYSKPQIRPLTTPDNIGKSSIREWDFLAFDTETLDGSVYMIAIEQANKSGKGYKITPTVYDIKTFEDLIIAFLNNGRIYHSRRRGYAHPKYGAYNLSYDAQAQIKLLKPHIIACIYQTNSVTINYETGEFVDYEDETLDHSKSMEIFYIPKKCLRFEFHKDHLFQPPQNGKRKPAPINGGKIEQWDICQFFGMSLKNAALIYTPDTPKVEKCFDGSILDVKKLGKEVMIKVKKPQGVIYEKHLYHEYYAADVSYYCAVDAHIAGRLGRIKLREFVESNVSFRDPYSVAAIAQRDLLNKGYKEVIMREDKYRPQVTIANHCFKGGHFEAAEVGMIEDVVIPDLKSAYPANQWNLPAMTKYQNVTYTTKDGEVKNRIKHGQPLMEPVLRGKFVTGKGGESFTKQCEPRIDLAPAYCLAYFVFPEGNKWNPLCYVGEKPPLTTPRIYRGWITYDEYKEAMKWEPVTAIVENWLVWEDETEVSDYPFRPFIKHWFDVKESVDAIDPAYLVSKVLLNSVYGKTIAVVNEKSGSLWQPFYASMTTAYTRMELARFNRYNGKKAVMVATDGIIIRRKDFVAMPERLLECPKNLGRWELEAENVDALIMMSGVYAIRERTATGVKSYFDCVDGKMVITTEMYKKEKSKFRGTASYFLNGETLGWFDFCRIHGDNDEETMTISKPYSMGESRHNFELMNIFEDRTIRLRACGDSTKRLYDPDNKPSTFNDLLTNSYELGCWDSYNLVDRVINGLVVLNDDE